MASPEHPDRVFLVGFPRSGTTLLQALVGAHPLVATFPETFFFVDLVAGQRRRRWLGLSGPGAPGRLAEIDSAAGHPTVARSARGSIALRIGFRQALAKRFFETLDAAAQSEGKMAWVEKTPSHLHSIGAIERYVPEAKFIHMLRSGEAAIASLFNVTQKHPDRWGGARSLDRCIGRWQQDVRCSHACVGLPNHCFVSYERLVEDPAAVLGRLVGWMGLPGEEGVIALMLSGYREQLARVAVKEPWKDGVGGDIANRNDARINELLSAAEQADLTRALAPERRLLSDLPFLSLPG